MHLRHLLIRNCKLMRQLEVPFVRADGSPRLWTVFVGENGTCKTTLLRAIAIAAAGGPFANNLVNDGPAYLDRRAPGQDTDVAVGFGFSRGYHARRAYPGIERDGEPPELAAKAIIGSSGAQVYHRSAYVGFGDPSAELRQYLDADDVVVGGSVLDEVRAKNHLHWFLAAYGTGRAVLRPLSGTPGDVPARDRMRSLFDPTHTPLGLGFVASMKVGSGTDYAAEFEACLRSALVDPARMATPRMRGLELRRQGTPAKPITVIESQQAGMTVGAGVLDVPAVWLSQGYQAVISLVADIIGNVWLEAGEPVALDDMEGIVLVDELDLHLHPTWQTEIVTGLKRTFPNMQFIVTTHSPLVLAGCTADEVWTLTQDAATGDVTAAPGQVSPMLLTASEMFREYFGVERTYASELGEALRQYVDLASNPYRTDAQDAEVATLRRHLLDHRVDVDYQPVPRKSAS